MSSVRVGRQNSSATTTHNNNNRTTKKKPTTNSQQKQQQQQSTINNNNNQNRHQSQPQQQPNPQSSRARHVVISSSKLDPRVDPFVPNQLTITADHLPEESKKQKEGKHKRWVIGDPTMIKTTDNTKQQLVIDNCVCNRPRALIMCRRCGFEDFGRVRTTCPAHKNRHALMDLQVCPDCRAMTLKEIPLPRTK